MAYDSCNVCHASSVEILLRKGAFMHELLVSLLRSKYVADRCQQPAFTNPLFCSQLCPRPQYYTRDSFSLTWMSK